MERQKSRLILTLLTLVAVLTQSLYGDDCCDDDCCPIPTWSICQALCPLHFTLCGELLYLKPSIEQGSFVITSSENAVEDEFFPSGHRHFNDWNYKPGYRIEGFVEVCCKPNSLGLRFTYFNGGHSDAISGLFLFDTIGFPGSGAIIPEDTAYAGTAHLQDHFRYYAVDATFSRLSLESCFDNLFLIMGLHYANIRHSRNFNSAGVAPEGEGTEPVANFLSSHSKFWGIGPELGIDYALDVSNLICCYGFFAFTLNARAAILCSNTHADYHFSSLRTAETQGVNLDNDHVWRVTPMVDVRLGGRYQLFCLCTNWCIEAGYEWIWYNDSVDHITGLDVAFAGISLDVYDNLNLQGPYLRICAAF